MTITPGRAPFNYARNQGTMPAIENQELDIAWDPQERIYPR
jgi:hypothetical protein